MKLLVFLLMAILPVTLMAQDVSAVDAEKLIGQKAQLTHRSVNMEAGVEKTRITFTAAADTNVHFYYIAARYPAKTNATQAYNDILAGNARMAGLETLTGFGDAALFHTDKQNFALLIFRKENRMFNLKINRINSKTSVAELHNLAKRLSEARSN